jgi:hypothetical protein
MRCNDILVRWHDTQLPSGSVLGRQGTPEIVAEFATDIDMIDGPVLASPCAGWAVGD